MKDPASTLENINTILLDKCGKQFITVSLVIFDLETKVATLAKAGHPPLIQVNKNTKEIVEHKSKGRLMGVYETLNAKNVKISLSSGDRFVLYTDGALEITNKEENAFGEENFKNLLLKSVDLPLSEFRDKFLMKLQEWQGGYILDLPDDITLVVVDIQ
jgi:serine phosphatase RsbU (regulator of sigma subunit)